MSEENPRSVPDAEPSAEPNAEASAEPSTEPNVEPSAESSLEPNAKPSGEPKAEPSAEPIAEPRAEPRAEPSAEPSAEPKAEPNAEPRAEPSAGLSAELSAEPKTEARSAYTMLANKSSYAHSSTGTTNDLIISIITIPPDGGWGWIIVTASFICNFVADGSMYTFGLFLDDISKSFNVRPTTVGIGNSMMTGFYLLTGPITCALINRCGFQIIGFLGGIIAGFAFLISSELNDIGLFLGIYGMIGGFGFGMVYVPSIVVVGFYFEKWRALATSIASTGSAAGIMGFPIIIDLLKQYSWQVKFKVMASICIFVSFLAILYRPLKPIRVVTRDANIVQYLPEVDSIGSFHINKKSGLFTKVFHRFHNVTYPTAAQVNDTSAITLSLVESAPSSELLNNASGESFIPVLNATSSRAYSEGRSVNFNTIYGIHSERNFAFTRYCRENCCKCCSKCSFRFHRNRPMYRDDIFYAGSLYKIPKYSKSLYSSYHPSTSKYHTMEYHMSVTRVRTQKDIQEEREHCKCCPESVARTLVTMLSCTLLKSPAFFVLTLSGFFTILGMYSPFIYMTNRVIEVGLDKSLSYHLFTTVGVTEALGRIMSGVISTIPQAKPLIVSYVSLFISGISTIASCYFYSAISQHIYFGVFGFTIACLGSLRTPIAAEMLGLESLTNAFGIILLFEGMGAFIGMPLAAVIHNATDSYNAIFMFAGVAITISALLLFPIKQISAWEKKKNKKNTR